MEKSIHLTAGCNGIYLILIMHHLGLNNRNPLCLQTKFQDLYNWETYLAINQMKCFPNINCQEWVRDSKVSGNQLLETRYEYHNAHESTPEQCILMHQIWPGNLSHFSQDLNFWYPSISQTKTYRHLRSSSTSIKLKSYPDQNTHIKIHKN